MIISFSGLSGFKGLDWKEFVISPLTSSTLSVLMDENRYPLFLLFILIFGSFVWIDLLYDPLRELFYENVLHPISFGRIGTSVPIVEKFVLRVTRSTLALVSIGIGINLSGIIFWILIGRILLLGDLSLPVVGKSIFLTFWVSLWI